MLEGLTFRRYEDMDHEAVWSVFAAAGAPLGFAVGPWDEDMLSISPIYLESGGEFIVGEYSGEIVAHAALLSNLATGPLHQVSMTSRAGPEDWRSEFALAVRSAKPYLVRKG